MSVGVISDLGRNLRLLRQTLGINQKELSHRSGVSQATISRLEAGRVRQVRSESLHALARSLEVSADELIAGPALRDRHQRRRHMEETVSRLRYELDERWLTPDLDAALDGLARALVETGVLAVAEMYRVDDTLGRLYQVCRAPDLAPPGPAGAAGYALADGHALARAVADGRPVVDSAGSFAEVCLPFRRSNRVTAVLHTWCPAARVDITRQWLDEARPLFDELAVVLELAARPHPSGATTPWARAAFDAVAVEEQGRIVDVNDAFCELSGFQRGQLLGRSRSSLVRPAGDGTDDGDLGRHAILTAADDAVRPVDVSSRRVAWDRRSLHVLVVRDNTEIRHEVALARVQRSFLDATADQLEPVLQAAFGELVGLGVDVQGLGINVLNPGEDSFVAHTLLQPARMYVDELHRDGAGDDYRQWLAHWQRREIWVRPFRQPQRADGYAPVEVIDIPFREGTFAAGLSAHNERYPALLFLLQRIAEVVSRGLGRLRDLARSTDPVLRSAWNAAADPAAIVDSRGFVRECNAPWTLAAGGLGLSARPVGQSLLDLCATGDRPCHGRFLAVLRRVLSGGRLEATDERLCDEGCPLAAKGGDSRLCAIRAVRLDTHSAQDGGLVLLSFRHAGGAAG